jgi:hypothetical protein
VEVLEGAPVAGGDDHPVSERLLDDTGDDRVDCGARSRGDVDAVVEVERPLAAGLRALLGKSLLRDRAGIPEVAADRMLPVERLIGQ